VSDTEKGPAGTSVEDRSKADQDAFSKLWAVYVGEAEKYDGDLLRGWKQDMEGLLIFVSFVFMSLTFADSRSRRCILQALPLSSSKVTRHFKKILQK